MLSTKQPWSANQQGKISWLRRILTYRNIKYGPIKSPLYGNSLLPIPTQEMFRIFWKIFTAVAAVARLPAESWYTCPHLSCRWTL